MPSIWQLAHFTLKLEYVGPVPTYYVVILSVHLDLGPVFPSPIKSNLISDLRIFD